MLLPLFSLAILFAPPPGSTTVCAACVRTHVERLASAEFNGRRCATADEARAADYLVAEMKRLNVAGGLPKGGHLQTVDLLTQQPAGPAAFAVAGRTLVQGRDFEVSRGLKPASGPLLRITDPAHIPPEAKGAVVFFDPPSGGDPPVALRRAGAAMILTVWPSSDRPLSSVSGFDRPTWIAGETPGPRPGPVIAHLRADLAEALRGASAGSSAELKVSYAEPLRRATHNVVGLIHGSAPDADKNAVLLTAHYDHLGMLLGKRYPGANDDASGTAAVLEMARLLKAGAKPKRTVVFALFGCEEEGGFGATYFDAHPALPIADIKANIEFEMIGFRDPEHPKLMMTGYERSNLGPTLADHGANIEQDPYPAQNFFQRSDNYALARVGVVAHTISAWPTPPTYHQPSDTAASVDFPFMAASIQSLIGPVRWLLNSDFTPSWNPGGKP